MNLSLWRNKKACVDVLKKIYKVNPGEEIRIMEVCGTHSQVIAKYGLKKLLPPNIKLVSGPGCPVCVTPASDIDLAIELTKYGIVTTFGDMYRVVGTENSLADVESRVVYSVEDSVKIAESTNKEVIHFAIGFETTAPSTAITILNLDKKGIENFSIICSHRLIPPAMRFLLAEDIKIDGFICPGHVSTIIGSKPYEEIAKRKPCVISGFEPLDVLISVYMILKQLACNESKVEIEYKRVVKDCGNRYALESMNKVFEYCDAKWRGIGLIPKSGLRVKNKFKSYDAIFKFGIKVKESKDIKDGCLCGEILKGLAVPQECPLFKDMCNPFHPKGPCMVSVEGACNVVFRYGENEN